ncbi:hypothetical protein FGG08_001054 [Glutinoglossum americanum]|uniref:Uncharacterized protein n=1 Tax=Glutinoglossum americanum TaxID=1670608 RepID=A0A9P8IBT1_9PEZI|nr:hypothetical protein FGG08_001054 [Glutinoglossum americanum]
MLFCSLSCYKVHKETHADGLISPGQPESPVQADITPPDGGAILQADKPASSGTPQATAGQFDNLLTSVQLNTLFQKYLPLRSQLQQIFAAVVGPITVSTEVRGLDQKRFGRGGSHGRGRGRGGGPPWTPERGMRDGLSRLKSAKELSGVEGEGIREFMYLVLKSAEGASESPCREASTGNEGEKLVEGKPSLLESGETIPDEEVHVAS